ncbi:UPF0764 protein C16orf89 homolog [Rhincodon typus]|uniref:UPF0764 protein C16orf89 homolog n=1 Tax=Rhincodon typus TaxID=259920 RepID=UPI0020307342|nr:UPF0764 protein C16orf89 homolog [Rhincodon typus]
MAMFPNGTKGNVQAFLKPILPAGFDEGLVSTKLKSQDYSQPPAFRRCLHWKWRMNAALIVFTIVSFVSAQETRLNDVISGLQKATLFFENEYDHFTLDGVVGFRMLQAHLEDTLKGWSLSGPEAASQFKKVNDLIRRLDFTAAKAIEAVKVTDPVYFNGFQTVLQVDFWSFNPQWIKTDIKLVYPEVRNTECFGENISDRCMTQLLGTWYVLSLNSTNVRRLEWKMNLKHYNTCIQLKLCKVLTRLQKVNIFNDCLNAQLMMKCLTFAVMLCGQAGFSEFFKAQWLDHILAWQQPAGCFGESVQKYTKHKRVKRRSNNLKGKILILKKYFLLLLLMGYWITKLTKW